jgi:NUMOD3 motif
MFRILDKDHPRLGISISEDIIAKMSEAQRRINRTGEKKNPQEMLGRIHSSDTLAKMSVAKGGGTIYDT